MADETSEVVIFADAEHLSTCEDCGAPPSIACSKCWPLDDEPERAPGRIHSSEEA